MAKSKLRLQAREFRRQGLGIKTIAYKLGVSSSTVSFWCRDILLTSDQIEQLSLNSRDPYYGRRREYLFKIKKQHQDKIQKLFIQGKKRIGEITKKELLIAGVALYWGEGFKKDSLVGFANSDPTMLKFFINWLNRCFYLKKSDLRVRLGVNEQYRDKVEEIESYWIQELDLKKEQFQKPFIQKVKWKKVYENQSDYHGVLRIRVRKSINLLRKINGMIDGLKKEVDLT